jgi:hypothetical protein
MNCNEVQEIHLEVFQMSKQAVQLYKDGWFVPPAEAAVLGHTKMQHPTDKSVKLPVMITTNDTDEVDNDFWLVAMPVLDHAGPWMLSFQVENRLTGQVWAGKAIFDHAGVTQLVCILMQELWHPLQFSCLPLCFLIPSKTAFVRSLLGMPWYHATCRNLSMLTKVRCHHAGFQ